MKKEQRTTDEWGTNCKEPQIRPRKSILRACDEIMEFQGAGGFVLMYMKTKELGWKESHGIWNIDIKDSKGNAVVYKRQVLKI